MKNVEKESHKGFNKLGLPDEVFAKDKEDLVIENPNTAILH